MFVWISPCIVQAILETYHLFVALGIALYYGDTYLLTLLWVRSTSNKKKKLKEKEQEVEQLNMKLGMPPCGIVITELFLYRYDAHIARCTHQYL